MRGKFSLVNIETVSCSTFRLAIHKSTSFCHGEKPQKNKININSCSVYVTDFLIEAATVAEIKCAIQ